MFYSRVLVSRGKLRSTLLWNFISRFVCLLIFISSLHKNQSRYQKARSCICYTHRLEKDATRVRLCAGLVLMHWVLPLLLEAWVSASLGVRKRRGSLRGLVPSMLMDWTCTMYSVSSSKSHNAQERVVVLTSWMNRSMRTFCGNTTRERGEGRGWWTLQMKIL